NLESYTSRKKLTVSVTKHLFRIIDYSLSNTTVSGVLHFRSLGSFVVRFLSESISERSASHLDDGVAHWCRRYSRAKRASTGCIIATSACRSDHTGTVRKIF